MFHLLRFQLRLIFISFLLLVGGSGIATFLAVREQAGDATLINLAGRQRMLTQKMTWLAMGQPDSLELAASVQLFDQTLHALRDGGQTFDAAAHAILLSPAPDPALRAQLDEVAQTWATFRSHLQPVDVASLQIESPRILAQLDSVVSAYETRAQAKVLRLQIIQIVFFAAALVLLLWSYFFTHHRILQPLAILGAVAQHLAEGHFADPVPPMNDDELGALGRAFETMRVQVAAAHDLLESRVTQRTRELASAFEFSQEIVAQLDLNHLLRSVTDRAQVLMQARAASLCLLAADGNYLEWAATSGVAAGPTSLRQPVQRGLAVRVIGAGETAVVEAACSSCGFLCAHAPGQCIAAPLQVGGRTLGALCAVRGNGTSFDFHEVRALTLLANSAAIAIANARLAEAGRRQAEQAASLAEREHLAAELHDHLAQTLSFLRLKVDRAKEMLLAGQAVEVGTELERMKPAIGEAWGQVRAALVGLHEPPPTTDAPSTGSGQVLAQKLTACLADFRQASGLPADLVVADPSALALPGVAQTQALHIVREALTNVRRHARAHHAWVRVERANGEARFTVEDDGCGFDLQAVEPDQHLGLVIMRTRAERSGGRLTVNSASGAGTKVVASFPLVAQASILSPSEITQ